MKQGRIEREPAEVLVLSHFEDEARLSGEAAAVDRALHGALRNLLKNGEFQGKSNQTVLLHTQGKLPAKRVLLVGLGKRERLRAWIRCGRPWGRRSSGYVKPEPDPSSRRFRAIHCPTFRRSNLPRP